MATKTITLEIDAYERLRAAKRHGESFSQVVRRAVFPDEPRTDAQLIDLYPSRPRRVSDRYLESVAEAAEQDPPPDDPWTRSAQMTFGSQRPPWFTDCRSQPETARSSTVFRS